MHQTFDKSSLAMTHKLDAIIELTKSQPKKTCEEDLECEMVMVGMHRCMSLLGSTNVYDEPIGNLDKVEEEVGNLSPQSTPQVLPSFEEYTPPVTYPKEVEETLRTPIEEEPLNQTKLEDVGFDSYDYNLSLNSMEVPSVVKPEPQPLPSFPSIDVIFDEEKPGSS
nr:hypothetical protein [Tanacetum cinerariifolium]